MINSRNKQTKKGGKSADLPPYNIYIKQAILLTPLLLSSLLLLLHTILNHLHDFLAKGIGFLHG